jgi:hypothetical protein
MWFFTDLFGGCSNATHTSSYFVLFSGGATQSGFVFTNCACDAANELQSFIRRSATAQIAMKLVNCSIQGCNSSGIDTTGSTGKTWIIGGSLVGNGSVGVTINSGALFIAQGVIIAGNVGDGINLNGTWGTEEGSVVISNCTIDDNADGIDISNSNSPSVAMLLLNNIISNNTVGVRGHATAQASSAGFNDYNNYFGNGTDRTNWGTGANDLALDPQYVNAAGGDYTIGTNLKAKGYPVGGVNPLNGTTYSYLDSGAAQRQEAGGGGGGIIARSLIAGDG